MQCPLLYRYRVVDRLPEPPSHAAARGTLVHSALERLFDLPAAERTPQAAVDLLEPAWADLVQAEPELGSLVATEEGAVADATAPDQAAGAAAADKDALPVRAEWLAQAAQLVRRWFEVEDPTRLEPAERELYVEVDVDGLTLRGYVDRLDIAPDGRMRVVDYKTGRAPSELFEARALFQMKFYALVLWRSRGVIPTLLQLVYLRDGQVLRYEPDEATLVATERKVHALWQAIERAAESQDWRPRRSRLCDWCHHKPICPAWGGQSPPLPADAAERAAAAASSRAPRDDAAVDG